jgi:dihydroorotate dehydrogenase electron transfer subunit
MPQENVTVLWNRPVSETVMHMGLSSRTAFRDAVPGQFVMVRTDGSKDPLLRRPFSIHQAIDENGERVGIELLYKIVGTVTGRLSTFRENTVLDLVAPLGQGFSLPEGAEKVFITAGGIGVAPVVFLASSLVRQGIKPSNCTVFIGGKTKSDVLCVDKFESLGMTVQTATDDGSLGHKGLVTDLIRQGIDQNKPDILYSCGPHPMLKAVADLADEKNVDCQVSVETLMACGLCACLGCAVHRRDDDSSYMHVCKNGPVFWSRDIHL